MASFSPLLLAAEGAWERPSVLSLNMSSWTSPRPESLAGGMKATVQSSSLTRWKEPTILCDGTDEPQLGAGHIRATFRRLTAPHPSEPQPRRWGAPATYSPPHKHMNPKYRRKSVAQNYPKFWLCPRQKFGQHNVAEETFYKTRLSKQLPSAWVTTSTNSSQDWHVASKWALATLLVPFNSFRALNKQPLYQKKAGDPKDSKFNHAKANKNSWVFVLNDPYLQSQKASESDYSHTRRSSPPWRKRTSQWYTCGNKFCPKKTRKRTGEF